MKDKKKSVCWSFEFVGINQLLGVIATSKNVIYAPVSQAHNYGYGCSYVYCIMLFRAAVVHRLNKR